MLSEKAIDSAIPLTEIMDSRNLVLTPIEGSPLDMLVKATRSDDRIGWMGADISNDPNPVPGVTSDKGLVPNKKLISYMANAKDPTFQRSPHDDEMEASVVIAAASIQKSLLFAKSVVAPAVADLVSRVHHALSNMDVSSLLGMEVVTWSPPALLTNNSFETSVRRFEEEVYDNPSLSMKLPSLTADEIMAIMKSGSKSINSDLEEWASSKGESFFLNLWESVFQIKQAELKDRRPVLFNTYTECPVEGIDNALAIYLLANNLYDNPPEKTEMSLKAFNNLIVDFRNQSGARLCRAIDDLDQCKKNNILVRSVKGNITSVNGDVYSKWIADGGENEVLFGNAMSSPPLCTVSQINENASSLKSKWNTHAVSTSVIESNRRFTRTKNTLLKEFNKQICELDDGDNTVPDNKEQTVQRFSNLLEDVRENDLDDLWGLALRLVCRSWFFKSDAERILAGLERIKKNNPTVTVREAAAISALEYCAWWVSKQMRVTVLK